ncbi:MAG: protoporphyrinogen oxidase [Candidatus Nealsonbacteria bacterium]|nr:protoporphyrinogen oxidase [Candidatus Nealsonbacteria bacterium]
MPSQRKLSRRIAVIGGGISGLAAAHRLVELDPDCEVSLLERRGRVGGALWTIHEDGFQIEQGVDNFITTIPWGLNLCRRLGLEDDLVQTNPKYRQTFVVRGGRLYKLPDGFLMMAPTRMWPLVTTPILSPLGKLRCALEYFIPPSKETADESMAAFVRRRLGREAYERLVEPLLSAVYAADLEKLSVDATLSRFREMEREHGSLVRAMRKQMVAGRKGKGKAESGPRFSMFVTLRRGLSSLVDAIVERLGEGTVRSETVVERICPAGNGWQVWTSPSDYLAPGDSPGVVNASSPSGSTPGESPGAKYDGAKCELFDAVVLATPSYVAGSLLEPLDAELGRRLATIEHSSTAVLTFGFDESQIGHPLDGMGIVVPTAEKSPILACSLSSRKYVHRAPEGKTLLRVFVGGSRYPEAAEMPEEELCPRVFDELATLLGIEGQPIYSRVARWPRTMPQYHVGHKDLVAAIESGVEKLPGLELCGNAYHGVGIPDCIHGGEQAAERVLDARS